MNPTSNNDLQRSLGRVEGNQDALKGRMDRIEQLLSEGFEKVEKMVSESNKRLAEMERREAERKGAWRVLAAMAGAIGGAVGAAAVAWFKGMFS